MEPIQYYVAIEVAQDGAGLRTISYHSYPSQAGYPPHCNVETDKAFNDRCSKLQVGEHTDICVAGRVILHVYRRK